MAVLWELNPAGATIVDGRAVRIPLTTSADLAVVEFSDGVGPVVVVDGTRTILHLTGQGDLPSDQGLLPVLSDVGYVTMVYGAPITAYQRPHNVFWAGSPGGDLVVTVGGDDVAGDLIAVTVGNVPVEIAFTPDAAWHVLTVTWDAATGFVVYRDGAQVGISAVPFSFLGDADMTVAAGTRTADRWALAGTRLAVFRADSGALGDPVAQATALLAQYGDIPLDIAGAISWTTPVADGGLPVTKYLVDLFVGGELLHAELGPEPNSLNSAPFVFDIFDFLGGPATGFVQVRAVNAAGASSPSLALEF